MKSKFDCALDFLNNNIKNFLCPICHADLEINNRSLCCSNNHLFDFTKKGTVSLINTSRYKKSAVYDKELFLHRRKFIKNNYYFEVYKLIANCLNKKYGKEQTVNILDIGCGEAIHTMNILNLLKFKYNYFGFDYSKDAINLASDYNKENHFFFVGDLTNIPIKDNSIDIILDFLSPYNEKEIKRVTNTNSIIIKVAPGKEYLKEVRYSQNMEDYANEKVVEENIKKNFPNYQKINIKNTYILNEFDDINLMAMTPIRNKVESKLTSITIDLNIYIIEGGL